MPLNTQVIRNGEALSLPWGDFHVAAMVMATMLDTGKFENPAKFYEPNSTIQIMVNMGLIPVTRGISFQLTNYGVIGNTELNNGEYVLKNGYKFYDPSDSEIFELIPGDILIAYRGW